MIVSTIRVGRVNPAPYNPRRDLQPGDPEYTKLARSIDEFGCVEPLVWNKRTGTLVGGHQRFKVLLERGARTVDVSVVDLPLEREKALNLALNKIGGDWDPGKLAELLEELTQTPDFDIGLTGFDSPEIDALFTEVFGEEGLQPESFDVAAALAAQGPTVTREGEIVALGEHRLLCGDSTDPNQVRRLIAANGGKKAILFATDPPYLVGYDGTNHPGEQSRCKSKSAQGAGRPVRPRPRNKTRPRPRQDARVGGDRGAPGHRRRHGDAWRAPARAHADPPRQARTRRRAPWTAGGRPCQVSEPSNPPAVTWRSDPRPRPRPRTRPRTPHRPRPPIHPRRAPNPSAACSI